MQCLRNSKNPRFPDRYQTEFGLFGLLDVEVHGFLDFWIFGGLDLGVFGFWPVQVCTVYLRQYEFTPAPFPIQDVRMWAYIHQYIV